MGKYGNYEVGDKFIIEIGSDVCGAQGMKYFIKGFNTLVFDDNGLDKLKRADKLLTQAELKEACDKARKEGYNIGYKDGRAFSEELDRALNYTEETTPHWVYEYEDGYRVVTDEPVCGDILLARFNEHGKFTMSYE